MLKVIEIAFSCYPVTDMARARKFYEGVLGLKPAITFGEPGGMQWTEYDIASGTLSLDLRRAGLDAARGRLFRCAGSGGLRRRHRAPEGQGREIQNGTIPHARLPHGIHCRS